MTPSASSRSKTERLPTPKERELGFALRKHRLAAGLKNKDVAAKFKKDASVVTRWENGERPPDLTTIYALGHLYNLSAEDLTALEETLTAAEQEAATAGWWLNYDLEDRTKALLSLEAGASSIESFEMTVMPGLLQTKDYAAAVITAVRPKFNAARVNSAVEARMKRRTILEENQANFHVVIDEGVLNRGFGGSRAMRDQLQALRKFSDYSNIAVQILRFSAAASPAQDGPFTLLRFAAAPDRVYTEGQLGQNLQQRVSDLERCREAFKRLAELAEDIESSKAIIDHYLTIFNES